MTGDTCPECGQPYPGAARDDDCLCGHAKAEHHLTRGGNLTYCYRVACGCDTYHLLGVPR